MDVCFKNERDKTLNIKNADLNQLNEETTGINWNAFGRDRRKIN